MGPLRSDVDGPDQPPAKRERTTTSGPSAVTGIVGSVAVRVGVIVVAANLALAIAGPSTAAVPIGLAAAAVAVLVARRGGLSWDELGLAAAQARRGLLVGVAAVVVVLAIGGMALVVPVTSDVLAGIPPQTGGGADLAYELAVRVLLGVALVEELLFRSSLLAALERRRPTVAAVWWSAVAFGAWHVLPALVQGGNGGAFGALDDVIGPAGAVGVVVVVTMCAGVILARIRLAGGHVVAAVLTHAAINSTASAAVLLAAR